MDKNASHRIIKDTLESGFDKNRFLIFSRNLLNKIDESKVFQYSGAYIPESFRGYIKSYERLGTYTDPEGKKIDVLIVYLQKATSLERARTAQRNFVARYLKERDEKDAGLAAFVSPNSEDWRFSLIKMEYKFSEGKSGKVKVKEEFTPARRWSFLVGANENSHTAKSRLAPIVQDDEHNPTLKVLEEAFNIEKVTKEFFEKYRDLFLRVKETLDDVIKKDPFIKRDFTEKGVDTVEFAKKLLGQVVFLYFLQKKGWFGVERDADWGSGPKNFLRQLFEKKHSDYKNFFNDILEPLFYEALARERDDDFYSRFNCKIPFLNGGLFDPINNYDWVHTDILLPDDLFSNRETKEGDTGDGILDVFDRYNFTVKEDEPLEKEVAVDPETLGKVFENLLEVKDRKSKGTYYTPREIVHYMCVQSLVYYLSTELDGNVSEEDLEKLIKYGETVGEHDARVEEKGEQTSSYRYKMPENVRLNAKLIDEKLSSIKACDPAIGSGAFLVGMMTEIVRARNTLSSYLKDPVRSLYNFKRDCIQNSLYGVDTDPSAVEIAKLRLWLSLVVDEDDIKQIKPLPNLDYKIMQGNSLLEEFEGIKLFDEKLISNVNFDKDKRLQNLKDKQNSIQKEYIKLHQAHKLTKTKKVEFDEELKSINNQIKRLSLAEKSSLDNVSLYDVYSSSNKKADELKKLHKEFFETTQKRSKDDLKKQIEKLEWDLIEATLKEQDKNSELKKLEEFKRANTKPFFLWKLHFSEIFQNGGFDVVIANPPYGIIFDNILKKAYEKQFDSFCRNNDIYVAFYERGLGILKYDGVLVYITPNTFVNGDYFKRLREFITTTAKINEIVDYKEFPIFSDPTVFVCILSCVKNTRIEYPYSYFIKTPEHSIDKLLAQTTDVCCPSDNSLKPKNPILSKVLSSNGNNVIDNLFFVKDVGFNYWTEGKGKKRDGDSIGDRVFYSGDQKNKKDTPFLKGRDIQRYCYQKASNHLRHDYAKYLDPKIDTFRFSENFLKIIPKLIYRQTSDRIVATIDSNANYIDKTVHLIVPRESTQLNLKYVLAILNSSLANYFYRYISQEREGRTFSQVKTTYIKQIPIPVVSDEKQAPFIDIVDNIFHITKTNNYLDDHSKAAEVRDYEKRLDRMIYKLYELTPAEIEIVEKL